MVNGVCKVDDSWVSWCVRACVCVHARTCAMGDYFKILKDDCDRHNRQQIENKKKSATKHGHREHLCQVLSKFVCASRSSRAKHTQILVIYY